MNIDQELLARFNVLSVQEKTKLVNGINREAVDIVKKMFPESQLVQQLSELKKQFSR
jgi:hypothetical protein